MKKISTGISLLCLLLFSACDAPTAPIVEEENVLFVHGESPEAPKKLAAVAMDNAVVQLSWEIGSPFTEKIKIKKEQYLVDANGHPCSLELTETLWVVPNPTIFLDTLDLKFGPFARYTFSTVYNNVTSLKTNEVEVLVK